MQKVVADADCCTITDHFQRCLGHCSLLLMTEVDDRCAKQLKPGFIDEMLTKCCRYSVDRWLGTIIRTVLQKLTRAA